MLFAPGAFSLALPAVLALTLACHAVHLSVLRHPRPFFHLLQKIPYHLGIALVCSVAAGVIAGVALAIR